MIQKTYRLFRSGDEARCEVRPSGAKAHPLAVRCDLRNHATSIEWGYDGGAVAQFSLSLLADHFGTTVMGDALASSYYLELKRSMVMGLPYGGGTIPTSRIAREVCALVVDRPDLTHHALVATLMKWGEWAESNRRDVSHWPSSVKKAEEYAGLLVELFGCELAFAKKLVSDADLAGVYQGLTPNV
jgi:hypothetical protein